jgi:hypothetical protein
MYSQATASPLSDLGVRVVVTCDRNIRWPSRKRNFGKQVSEGKLQGDSLAI